MKLKFNYFHSLICINDTIKGINLPVGRALANPHFLLIKKLIFTGVYRSATKQNIEDSDFPYTAYSIKYKVHSL